MGVEKQTYIAGRLPQALALGIAGSFFFAFNFVLLRSMNLSGGFWLWGAVLRYVFTLLIFLPLVIPRGLHKPVIAAIKNAPWAWLGWSTVGFGLFYAPLSAASVFGESWVTSATWQVTIVCGVLLTPLFGRRIPKRNLALSCLILLGIAIMQAHRISSLGGSEVGIALLLTVIGAFSYPLGNRKMMEVCRRQEAIPGIGELSTVQRVFGMTLCSMPFWIVGACVSGAVAGAPSGSQCIQAFLVALLAGVIATLLFFRGTDIVCGNTRHLAIVEATQSGEVIFTLILGVLLLGDPSPDTFGWIGLVLIVVGMTANSLLSGDGEPKGE